MSLRTSVAAACVAGLSLTLTGCHSASSDAKNDTSTSTSTSTTITTTTSSPTPTCSVSYSIPGQGCAELDIGEVTSDCCNALQTLGPDSDQGAICSKCSDSEVISLLCQHQQPPTLATHSLQLLASGGGSQLSASQGSCDKKAESCYIEVPFKDAVAKLWVDDIGAESACCKSLSSFPQWSLNNAEDDLKAFCDSCEGSNNQGVQMMYGMVGSTFQEMGVNHDSLSCVRSGGPSPSPRQGTCKQMMDMGEACLDIQVAGLLQDDTCCQTLTQAFSPERESWCGKCEGDNPSPVIKEMCTPSGPPPDHYYSYYSPDHYQPSMLSGLLASHSQYTEQQELEDTSCPKLDDACNVQFPSIPFDGSETLTLHLGHVEDDCCVSMQALLTTSITDAETNFQNFCGRCENSENDFLKQYLAGVCHTTPGSTSEISV